MLMRKLGRTGLKVAALCLGGNTFGWTTDQKASEAVLDAYVEAGGNFIDTADVYSRWAPGNKGGESETALGIWMTARKNRHAVADRHQGHAGRWGTGPNDTGLSRQHIMEGVEASLRRLQTDYIDLYQAHWDDQDTPLDETLRAFDDLVRQGKVRYIGASNYHGLAAHPRALGERQAAATCATSRCSRSTTSCSATSTSASSSRSASSRASGVIPYSSLASGFLSGKYRAGSGRCPRPPAPPASQKSYMNDRGFAVLAAVDKVAGGGRRHAGPGRALLARPPPRHHRADRERDLAGAAQGADGGIELQLDAEAHRRARPGERLAGGLGPPPA